MTYKSSSILSEENVDSLSCYFDGAIRVEILFLKSGTVFIFFSEAAVWTKLTQTATASYCSYV